MIILILTTTCCVFNAQSYQIDVHNNDTITDCSGNAIFYDSGGQFGSYQANENYTITFCPVAGSGEVVNVDFTTFNLGSSDELCAYDGGSILDPIIDVSNVIMF